MFNRFLVLFGFIFFFAFVIHYSFYDSPHETSGSTEFVTLSPSQNSGSTLAGTDDAGNPKSTDTDSTLAQQNLLRTISSQDGSQRKSALGDNEGSNQAEPVRGTDSVPDESIRRIPDEFADMEINVDASGASSREDRGKVGPTIEANENSYISLPMRAFPDVAGALYQTSQVVDRLLGFVIVRSDSADLKVEEGSKPVVKNQRNGRLGIITGTLIVQFRSAQENFLQFGRDLGLLPLTSDSFLKTAYFQVQGQQDFALLLEKAEQDPRVAKVTVEIVDTEKRVSP